MNKTHLKWNVCVTDKPITEYVDGSTTDALGPLRLNASFEALQKAFDEAEWYTQRGYAVRIYGPGDYTRHFFPQS